MNAIPAEPEFKNISKTMGRSNGQILAQWTIRCICLAGLAVANYYSFSMTATGFVETKLLPKNNIISDTLTPYLVAGFVQLGIFAFYLSMPHFSRRTPFLQIAAVAMVLPLLGLTILFSLFAITFTADGEKLAAGRANDIITIGASIADIDRSATDKYNQYIRTLEANRGRANLGQDGTGIATCGRNCHGFDAKIIDTTTRFDPALKAYASAPAPDGKDARRDVRTLQDNLARLDGKIRTYNQFVAAAGLPASADLQGVGRVRQQLQQLAGGTTDANNDKSGLVLDNVFAGIGATVHGRGEPRFALSLLIAILPDFLSWLFSILIRIQDRASATSNLPSEADLKKKTAFWIRAKAAAEESFRAWKEYSEVRMQEAIRKKVHEQTFGGDAKDG